MTPERVAELQCSVGITAGTFPQRLAATGTAAQALYGALLPTFAATGTPPALRSAAHHAGLSPARAEAALRELAAADLVALDASGSLIGAFPLSARPTRHRVHVGDRPVLHAMCAVDALGVPAMLGAAGVVSATDPSTERAITVTVGNDGALTVEPPGAVVLLATAGAGSLADACCSVIDFHVSAEHADRRLSRPDTTGAVLSVVEAHALGVALFADLPAR